MFGKAKPQQSIAARSVGEVISRLLRKSLDHNFALNGPRAKPLSVCARVIVLFQPMVLKSAGHLPCDFYRSLTPSNALRWPRDAEESWVGVVCLALIITAEVAITFICATPNTMDIRRQDAFPSPCYV